LLGKCSEKIVRIIRKAGALKKSKILSKTGNKLKPAKTTTITKLDKKNDK
jgi:hypothetical protein